MSTTVNPSIDHQMNSSDEAAAEASRRAGVVLARLQSKLKAGQLVIVVGAGVTLNVTADASGKPLSRITWRGLIKNGLDYLVSEDYVSRSNDMMKRAYNALREDLDTAALLGAADVLSSQLEQYDQFPTWLESVFGSLQVTHPALLEGLKKLHQRGAILLTTNYDDLLEEHCRLRRIGRSNVDDIIKFKRGELDGVFHVHGSYHDPHEVVLNSTDYYQVTHSDEVQNVLKTFLEYKTILFVGCGSGLEDPNFDMLLKWASERQKNVPNRHCLLIRDEDELKYPPLVRLKYGPSYQNLASYLAKLLDDQTQNLGTSTNFTNNPRSFTSIPFIQNDDFVTRDSIFKALDKLLSQDKTYHTAAIWGLGGSGKTQIALEYAYRQRKKTSCSIFWVHADNEARFTEYYTKIAKLAGLSSDLKGEDLLQEVRQWIEQQTNWVLILDNADDLKIFKNPFLSLLEQESQLYSPKLHRFIPKSPNGMIVWTSRDGGIIGNLVGIEQGIQLGMMTDEESLRLFQRLSGTSNSLEPSESEAELLGFLEKLPLAISQAAAYIRKTKTSIARYLALFKESEERKSDLLSKEFEDVNRSDVPNSVMRTWLISMGQIAQESECAEKILNTVAFLDNKGLPFELLGAAAGSAYSEDDVLLAAGRLHEYSFLQIQRPTDESLPIYEQHHLVQLATRRALNPDQTTSFSGKALQIMNTVFPSGRYETWNQCRLYLPHSLKAVAWREAQNYNEQAPPLLSRIGYYYWTEGRSNEAEKLEVEVLELQRNVLGEKHPNTISAMANLAVTWHEQGRFDETEQLEIEVLELRKSLLGEKHPSTIIAMANLAETWYQQSRFDEAEQLGIEVFKLLKSVLGEKHPDTIKAMANLAGFWHQQGRFDEIEQLEIEVLEFRKSVLGEKHPDTIRAIANLAITWHQQGRFDEAEQLEVEVLKLRKKVLGEKHPDTITAMAHQAGSWRRQGRFDEAEQLEIEILEFRKSVLGEKHPDTIWAMANLAITWHQQGRFDEAEQLEVEVLKLRKKVLGEKHPDTITAMAHQAGSWRRQGRFDEAEQLEIEILKFRKSVLGEKHPDTIWAMANLAITWHQQGRFDEAEQLEIEVLKLRKNVLGEKHPDTINAMNNMASIRLGDNEAEQLEVESSSYSDFANTHGGVDQPRDSSRQRLNAWKNRIRNTLRR